MIILLTILLIAAAAGLVKLYLILVGMRNDIVWEHKMARCPKCGHKAITVYWNGENYPPFFTAECGAREHLYKFSSPPGFFDSWEPLTEEQKECRYFFQAREEDGVEAPRFGTRKGAVDWWNKMAAAEKKAAGKSAASGVRL